MHNITYLSFQSLCRTHTFVKMHSNVLYIQLLWKILLARGSNDKLIRLDFRNFMKDHDLTSRLVFIDKLKLYI